MPAHRRSPWVLASVLLLLALDASAASQKPSSIASGGQQREYILVTPDTAPPGPRPLVLVLHGHLGTAANALGGGMRPSPLSVWNDIVEREKNTGAAGAQGLGQPDRLARLPAR